MFFLNELESTLDYGVQMKGLIDRVCSILDLIEEQYLNILAVYRFQNVAVKVVVNVFWFSFCCYAEKVT